MELTKEQALNVLDSVLVYLSSQYHVYTQDGGFARALDYQDAHTLVVNAARSIQ